MFTDSQGVEFECKSDGWSAQITDAVRIDENRIEANYQVQLDEQMREVVSESLLINGQIGDKSKGRVYLIDFADEFPAFKQKNATLPAIEGALESTDDVRRIVQSIEDAFRKDFETKDFFR